MDASDEYPQAGMYIMGRCLIVSVQVELYDDVISQVQQGILVKVRESHIRGVVLDVSMVEVMDAHIAQSLAETLQMVDMMGACSVMVGIRPAVASALMDLDVPPLAMRTAVTLEQGMKLLEPFIRDSAPAAVLGDGTVPADAPAADTNAEAGDRVSPSDDAFSEASATYTYQEGISGHRS